MDAIQIRDVTKTFDSVTAVDRLSLTVPEGSIYGFIGPNGSGKTTTMRMIVGIFHPDSGSIDVLGAPMSADRSGTIGYLPEERGIYRKMTVRSLIEFHGELRSGGKSVTAEVDAWLKRFDLANWATQRIETLSKGMTQKVQFIAAIVPRPRLLILDEPFSGLDPVSAQSIREAILELRASGSTVVLSTHDMGVAEAMCDRIFMIFRGKKVLDGTLTAIQEEYASDTLRITAENGGACLNGIPGVELIRDSGEVQEVRLARSTDPQDVLRALVARTRVTGFAVAKPSLHDIFIRIADPAAGYPAEEMESQHA